MTALLAMERVQPLVWASTHEGHRHGHTTYYYPRETCPICNRRPRQKRSTRPRDSQRNKLYTAERTLDATPDLESMLYTKLFLDKVVASAYYRKHYNTMTVDLRDGRCRKNACAEGGYLGHGIIRLPRWARSKLVALHELAHLAVARKYGRSVPSHGREFAAIYLDLVRHVLGEDKGNQLQAAFRAQGVRFKPKRQGSGNRKGNAEALRRWRETRKLAS